MILSIVVAVSENGVIGRDNQLPWHLPADLKFFKATTTGHTIIMGRKTFDSIGRALPSRRNIVITRNAYWKTVGVEVVHSLEKALDLCKGEEEVFLIGGGSLYAEALAAGKVSRIYKTLVHTTAGGDTFFDETKAGSWKESWREEHKADEKNLFDYTFMKLEKSEEKGVGV